MKNVFNAIFRYLKQTDRTLLLFSLLSALYGLVLVISATHSYGGITRTSLTQIIAIVLGFATMIVLSKIDYHTIAGFWKIIAVISVLLLLYTIFFGKQRTGSEDRSWLYIGSFSFQPAEFIKVFFIVTFAKHFDMVKDDISSPKNVLLLGVHAAVPIGLILLTKDMGMMLVFIVIFVTMIFASNVKMRYFAGGAIALLISAPFIWNNIFGKGSTQQNRILALFDPTNIKYKDEMLQQNDAIKALGSGQIWGYGLFKGPRTQSPVSAALPERQNDMIFAVAGEELGLIGCIAVIFVLTVLLVRFLIVASQSKDSMGAMICIGVFSMFSVQIIVNLGMVLRILPVVGLTLPFFSSGGTSAVSSFLAIGLVLSVFMHRKDFMFSEQSE